jgi:hypothetical protein
MIDINALERGDQNDQALPFPKDPIAILCKWFGRLIGIQVPVGCEDEGGFHYILEPAPIESCHAFDI